MAVQQIAESVQNDGNFCQLDLQDVSFGGDLMRIETFRCSQPIGKYGTTLAGTDVKFLAGIDHLTPISNRVFRHVFSVGNNQHPKITLEIRETFDSDGVLEVRTRDLDPESPSFGYVLITKVSPGREVGMYAINYEVRKPRDIQKTLVTSPLLQPIASLVPGMKDIGAREEELGDICMELEANPLAGEIHWRSKAESIDAFFDTFSSNFQREPLARWSHNIQVYERFGDFRDKCIHPGTNLAGKNPKRASEYILIRAYRLSLIILGRIADPDMRLGGLNLWQADNPLDIDPKPGVYSVFLAAYMLNIGIYQLGIDKVHSDYGGIPMALAPGSKLETGATPIVDATALNRTLAELAVAFYLAPRTAKTLEEQREIISLFHQ